MGTSPTGQCGTGGVETWSDFWPPDLVKDNTINILDVLALKTVFNTSVSPTATRYDFNASGNIDILDVLAQKPYFGFTCTEGGGGS